MTTRVGSLLRLTVFMVTPLAAAFVSMGAAAQTIKIGEINSYKAQPAFLGPYKKGWVVVDPNYEYGQSAVATFKRLLKAAQPDVEFVADQAAPLGKLDAGAVTQALADAKPDAIFNVEFGADLGKFVREGNTRGLFKARSAVSF